MHSHKSKLSSKSLSQTAPGSGQSLNRSAPEIARGDELDNDHHGEMAMPYSDNSRSVPRFIAFCLEIRAKFASEIAVQSAFTALPPPALSSPEKTSGKSEA
jgi:hypothetical protein